MQAERDMQSLIKHDKRETVGNDRTRLVGRNEDLTIGQDLTKMVNRNEREVTGANRSVTVGVNRSTQIGSIDSTIDTGAGAEISMTPSRIELTARVGGVFRLPCADRARHSTSRL